MAKDNNYKIDKLTLITGQNIAVSSPAILLNQPTLKMLGLLGQANFYSAAVLLAYPKRFVKLVDESMRGYATDFDIIMTIFRQDDDVSKQNSGLISLLLSLLFNNYSIKIVGNMWILNDKNDKQTIINAENYEGVRQAIIQMFCLEEIMGEQNTEVQESDGPMVRALKEKFRKRHEMLAKIKKTNAENDILSRYSSIVAVGLQIPITAVNEFTVYQLFDEYKRAQLKDAFDLYIKRATSFGGVKKEEKPENWQRDLSETSDD